MAVWSLAVLSFPLLTSAGALAALASPVAAKTPHQKISYCPASTCSEYLIVEAENFTTASIGCRRGPGGVRPHACRLAGPLINLSGASYQIC